jgi:hypothetical protein
MQPHELKLYKKKKSPWQGSFMKAKLRDNLCVTRVEPYVILYVFYAYALISDTEDSLFHHP